MITQLNRTMKGISINDQKLHEVRMLTIPYDAKTVSHLVYPKSRIKFQLNEDKLTLCIPPMPAIELYRTGILPQDNNKEFPVHVSGRKAGIYTIVDFRYPNSHYDDYVTITMKQQ